MKIQINTDNNLTANDNRIDAYTKRVSDALERYSRHITRVEIHLSDENAGKQGENDKRCVIEARIEGKQPIAVVSTAGTMEESLKDGLQKISSLLATIVDQMTDPRRNQVAND